MLDVVGTCFGKSQKMTTVSKRHYTTPRNQRTREFVREKMGVAFIIGYFVGAIIVAIFAIYYQSTH